MLLVIKFIVVMTVTLWLAITTGNYLERRIQKADELTPSLRVLFGKMLKITLVVIAVVIATTELGIDLTAFTIFSGAVGVGLGFGLQKVVSNFVSGIIILLDRSIKPGDTISLGDTFGWIRELSARFVSVVTRDGREHLIPNENFVTQEVINWSFSNELIRLDVPFGVSYESDPHEVSAMAIAAAASVPRVLSSQKPVCWMTNFGESSLEFVLRFWINDPQNGLTNIRGKVLLALWDVFKLNNVNIPFPHREIVLRNPLQVSNVSPLKPEAD
ncbi:MAG TPA: mechanosensitive ion channel domain-containing protein [Gammaproteobacteria bacterium]|nr:mechanosensitive ion channel domain-containing protein [Gammaproteobacteria bacterium]